MSKPFPEFDGYEIVPVEELPESFSEPWGGSSQGLSHLDTDGKGRLRLSQEWPFCVKRLALASITPAYRKKPAPKPIELQFKWKDYELAGGYMTVSVDDMNWFWSPNCPKELDGLTFIQKTEDPK